MTRIRPTPRRWPPQPQPPRRRDPPPYIEQFAYLVPGGAAARRIRRVLDALELAQDVTERQTAARIYLALYEAGLRPGPILVQFGSNTALPHQEPTDKKLRRGDAVVIDVSAAYEGYYADLTNSFIYGEPPRKYLEVHQAVEKAQAEAIKAAAPGVQASEVDKAARSTIEAAGYGPGRFDPLCLINLSPLSQGHMACRLGDRPRACDMGGVRPPRLPRR